MPPKYSKQKQTNHNERKLQQWGLPMCLLHYYTPNILLRAHHGSLTIIYLIRYNLFVCGSRRTCDEVILETSSKLVTACESFETTMLVMGNASLW